MLDLTNDVQNVKKEQKETGEKELKSKRTFTKNGTNE